MTATYPQTETDPVASAALTAHASTDASDAELAAEAALRVSGDAVLDAAKQDELSGTVDSADARVLITPTTSTENALIVKAPDANWGDENVVGYGQGQALMVLREDYAEAPNGGGVDAEPDKNVMFRVDRRGALGTVGGLHIATGLRKRTTSTFTQSIWIDPVDDVPGILLDAANNAPTSAYQQWRLNDGTVIAEVNSGGVVVANRGLTVRSVDSSTAAALLFGRSTSGLEAQVSVVGATNQAITGSAAGDMVVKNQTSTSQVLIGSGTGTAAIRVNGTPGLGFYGTAPQAKKTVSGSRGANAALASLLTQLSGYGLITDSSTA